jgi:hypothetical protein
MLENNRRNRGFFSLFTLHSSLFFRMGHTMQDTECNGSSQAAIVRKIWLAAFFHA